MTSTAPLFGCAMDRMAATLAGERRGANRIDPAYASL